MKQLNGVVFFENMAKRREFFSPELAAAFRNNREAFGEKYDDSLTRFMQDLAAQPAFSAEEKRRLILLFPTIFTLLGLVGAGVGTKEVSAADIQQAVKGRELNPQTQEMTQQELEAIQGQPALTAFDWGGNKLGGEQILEEIKAPQVENPAGGGGGEPNLEPTETPIPEPTEIPPLTHEFKVFGPDGFLLINGKRKDGEQTVPVYKDQDGNYRNEKGEIVKGDTGCNCDKIPFKQPVPVSESTPQPAPQETSTPAMVADASEEQQKGEQKFEKVFSRPAKYSFTKRDIEEYSGRLDAILPFNKIYLGPDKVERILDFVTNEGNINPDDQRLFDEVRKFLISDNNVDIEMLNAYTKATNLCAIEGAFSGFDAIHGKEIDISYKIFTKLRSLGINDETALIVAVASFFIHEQKSNERIRIALNNGENFDDITNPEVRSRLDAIDIEGYDTAIDWLKYKINFYRENGFSIIADQLEKLVANQIEAKKHPIVWKESYR
ncbi:lipase chaperone [Candidatus Beckwithbacteria bacterium]|nr:lipase chaperone [Candidatus Beckwithbacteria bacterium]